MPLAGRGRGAGAAAAADAADAAVTAVTFTPSFELRARVRPATVIALVGELDIAAVGSLERTLAAIDFTHVRSLTLDLSGLEFIDASGVRAVFRVRDVCREHSVVFSVTRGRAVVQRVFVLTNTEGLLPFEPGSDVDERAVTGDADARCRA